MPPAYPRVLGRLFNPEPARQLERLWDEFEREPGLEGLASAARAAVAALNPAELRALERLRGGGGDEQLPRIEAPIELEEVSPGVFAMQKPSRPSARAPRPRLSEQLEAFNAMGERLELQLGAAIRKAYRR